MDDRHDLKLINEIDEITARIKTIMAKIEKLDPVKNEDPTLNKDQAQMADEV
jgi:hypothetical protein